MITNWIIAFYGLFLIGLLISSFVLAPWDVAIMWLYMSAAYVLTFSELTNFKYYNGYGVAGRVNHEIGYKILSEYKLVAKRYAIEPLYKTWTNSLFTGFALLLISYLLRSANEIASMVVLVLGLSFLSSVLAQAYVWMMFGRRYHWCVAESLLMSKLINKGYDESEVKLLMERLVGKGYVLVGA